MGLRNKFEQLDGERRRAEEAQRSASEAISRVREEQRSSEEAQEKEAVDREKRRITEANGVVIQQSGIDSIMKEAANIKKTKLGVSDDNSSIMCAWEENSDTGEPLGTVRGLIAIFQSSVHLNYPYIVARIEAQAITICGSSDVVFRGSDMYDRDKLENAVANALINPGPPPSSLPPVYDYPSM